MIVKNSPVVRGILYGLAVLAQVVAFFVGDLGISWSDAMQQTANFLGGLAGMTALGNLAISSGPRKEEETQ